jgi:hypothetical protein
MSKNKDSFSLNTLATYKALPSIRPNLRTCVKNQDISNKDVSLDFQFERRKRKLLMGESSGRDMINGLTINK